MTYSEIDLQSNKIGNYLKDAGIRRGDQVALLYENSFNYICAYFGILKAGAAAVALNTDNKAYSLIYMLNDSGAKIIISNKRYSRQLIPALEKSPHLNGVIVDQKDITAYTDIKHCSSIHLNDIYNQGEASHPGVRVVSTSTWRRSSTPREARESRKGSCILTSIPSAICTL